MKKTFRFICFFSCLVSTVYADNQCHNGCINSAKSSQSKVTIAVCRSSGSAVSGCDLMNSSQYGLHKDSASGVFWMYAADVSTNFETVRSQLHTIEESLQFDYAFSHCDQARNYPLGITNAAVCIAND